MKKGFVQTENFRRLKEAATLVERRGAREAGYVLVRGVPGIGKSELIERWATDSGYVFVRAKETWTKHTVLREIAGKLGIGTDGNAAQVQDRIIGQLAMSMKPIIIDEADHLVDLRSASKLEVIRDITDVTCTMCFLVGMKDFPMKVARYEHIASRVAKLVELEPLSIADVQAAVTAKSEVAMDSAVVAAIHQQASGRMRLVLNAIANVEQWAQANSWSKVTMAEVQNKAMVTEFTGKAVARGNK